MVPCRVVSLFFCGGLAPCTNNGFILLANKEACASAFPAVRLSFSSVGSKIRAKPSLGEGACTFLKQWLILEKKFFLRHLERGLYGIQEGFECVPRDASLCRHALLRHAGARRRHNGDARNRRQPPRRAKPAHLAAGNMQRTCA